MERPHNKTYGTLRLYTHEEDVDDTDELDEPDHEQPIGSYVQQWGQILAADMGQQDVAGVTAIDGVDYEVIEDEDFDVASPAGNTNNGIHIGDGAGTEDIKDTALAAQLVSEFDYGAVTVGTGTVSGSSVTLDVTGTFTNVSGSQQTITEVGLVCQTNTVNSGNKNFLIVRDVLASDVDVDDGDNHTVEYTLEFQV